MVINVNRTSEPMKIINNGVDYAKQIGVDKFFDHFIVNHADDMENAISSAPGGALMFMIQTHIEPNSSADRKLLNEVCKRLCKDESEYKKYFSDGICED